MSQNNLEAIVIGNDHYNTLNVIRALGREGILVKLIVLSDSDKSFVSKSRHVRTFQMMKTLSVDEIIEKYNVEGKRIVMIPTTDAVAAELDDYYDRLSEYFILPTVGFKQGCLRKEMDKDIQLHHAANAGFDVPQSVAVNLTEDYQSCLSEVKYPCLVKPEESIQGCKDDFRVCGNEKELSSQLEILSNHLQSVLVQEFIPNDEVILVAGVRDMQGRNHIYGEVNKIKHGTRTNNMGLNLMGFWKSFSELNEACAKYVKEIDYYGCYSIDCIRRKESTTSGSRNYFLEINLRTDGLLFFYTKGGINYPAIWVKSCYGLQQPIDVKKKKIYGMNEFTYLKNSLSLSSFRDFLKIDAFSVFDIRDIKPFIYRFIYHGKN